MNNQDKNTVEANVYLPTVVETTARGERESGVFSRLLKDRIVFIGSPITDEVANAVIAQLLFLESDAPGKEISIYINSRGGDVAAGLAIYDTMQFINSDVSTLCLGQAHSIAALLLASGTKGRRFSLPHARLLLHQPLAGFSGQAVDAEIQTREILHIKDTLNQVVAKHTGKTAEDVAKDTDRELYLGPVEALAYGLIDQVVE